MPAERHLQTRGAVPCTEDLAEAVGIGAREMESLLRVQRQPLSIDESGVKEGSRTLAELVADPRQECPSDRLDQSSLEQRMDEILGNLDIRERQVLRMRYGLQGEQPLSLERHRQGIAGEQGADSADRRKRDVQAAAAAARRAVRPVLSRIAGASHEGRRRAEGMRRPLRSPRPKEHGEAEGIVTLPDCSAGFARPVNARRRRKASSAPHADSCPLIAFLRAEDCGVVQSWTAGTDIGQHAAGVAS